MPMENGTGCRIRGGVGVGRTQRLIPDHRAQIGARGNAGRSGFGRTPPFRDSQGQWADLGNRSPSASARDVFRGAHRGALAELCARTTDPLRSGLLSHTYGKSYPRICWCAAFRGELTAPADLSGGVFQVDEGGDLVPRLARN